MLQTIKKVDEVTSAFIFFASFRAQYCRYRGHFRETNRLPETIHEERPAKR